MRGSIYVIAEILVFLLAAAVIGYLIGRLTSRGDRAEPLKRLPEVDVGQAKSAADKADQSADLRRRLGIAYQTIRELEESNMLLRESAEGAAAPGEDEGEDDGESPATIASSDDAAGHDDAAGDGDGDAAATDAGDHHDGSVEDEAEPAPSAPDAQAAVSAAPDESDADTHDQEASDDQSPAGPAERIRAAKEAKDAAAANATSVQGDVADQLAAKDEEISRLKADLDRQMSQMGDLASRINNLEA